MSNTDKSTPTYQPIEGVYSTNSGVTPAPNSNLNPFWRSSLPSPNAGVDQVSQWTGRYPVPFRRVAPLTPLYAQPSTQVNTTSEVAQQIIDNVTTQNVVVSGSANAALKPAQNDFIQYVSPNGNDSNDGLSWGTAKLTFPAAATAIGSSPGMIFESPELPGSDGIASTGSATGLNGFVWAPTRFYLGPLGQATSGNTGVDSRRLRWAGSVWNGSKAVDDFWEFYVNSFSGSFSDGSNFIISHSSVEGGSGRVFVESDFVIANPRDATGSLNSNSFAFDNQGSYFDGGGPNAMLWEMANTVNGDGLPLSSTIFRQNFVPIFESSATGVQAEFALGGSGTLGVSGNYSGPPKWLFTNLRSSSFHTVNFEHSATAARTMTFPDATGTMVNSAFADLASGTVLGWAASGISPLDTGLSRSAAAAVAIGNGTAGDASGTLIGKTVTTGGSTSVFSNVGVAVSGSGLAGANPAMFFTNYQYGSVNNAGSVASYDSAVSLVAAAYTISNLYHFLANNPSIGSGAAITNHYGFYCGALSGATNNWGFYNAGSTPNNLGTGLTSAGTLALATSVSGGAMQFSIANSATGGSTWYLGSTDNGNGSGGGKFVVNNSTSTGTAALTIDGSGNVGVNQTSPGAKFEVNGTSKFDGIANHNGNAIQNAVLQGASNGNSVSLLNEQGPLSALTGNSADQVMYTYSMPANTMAAGRGIRGRCWFKHNTGTAATVIKFSFGNTSYMTNTTTAGTASQHYGEIAVFNNSGVTNAQHGSNFQNVVNANTHGFDTFSGLTSSVDTTAAVTIQITFNVANTDTFTPEQFIIELIQ